MSNWVETDLLTNNDASVSRSSEYSCHAKGQDSRGLYSTHQDTAKSKLSGNIGKPKILIVEDDEMCRYLYCEYANIAGWEAVSAVSGVEAAKIIEEGWVFSLVLLDLCLPGQSGFDVIRLLRSTLCELPVYAMSTNADYRHEASDPKYGFNGFLQKPFSLQQFMSVCRKAYPNLKS
ncbi:MAG: response regulator [Bacteroidetes bacterium]|nr:response regulator [Bacteroidota bacterium]MBU1721007.1 response regulator [Bacteroidota bacterium]